MEHRNGAFFHEDWLRDEVLYLHSLWYQGPHLPYARNCPTNTNRYQTIAHLRPRSSVKISKDRKLCNRRKIAAPSEKEWPCDPDPDPNQAASTGWPEPQPRPASRLPNAEELAAALATRAQKNAVEMCKIFFCKKGVDGDSEEGDLPGDSEEEDVEEEVEERAFKHFMDLFTKDSELRRYYEANHEKGEFLCLVCEGSGEKKWRTYCDCGGLVQHCSNVAKTGRIAAHRGLAKTVCRVVGWNFNRLPMLVLDFEDTLGQTLDRDASLLQATCGMLRSCLPRVSLWQAQQKVSGFFKSRERSRVWKFLEQLS